MAEQYPQGHAIDSSAVPPTETTDRRFGLGLMRKKEDKPQYDHVMTDTDVEKAAKEEEKHTLMNELQRTQSHSSSSSEEEYEEGGEIKKRKKNKGLREEIKGKFAGDKEGEGTKSKDIGIPTEKQDEINGNAIHPDEKKGFLEKIKEKLPGHHKTDEVTENPPAYEHSPATDANEKKGIIDKIKDKLPGHHKNDENQKHD